MSLAARGAFFELLQAAWEFGGKLPNAPTILWRYSHAACPDEFQAVAGEVLAMFVVSEDGNFLVNDTLAEEWLDAEAHMQEVSEKRRAAANKRWGKAGCKNAKPMQKDTSAMQTDAPNLTLPDLTGIDPSEGERKPCVPASAGNARKPKPVPDQRHKPTELHIKAKHLEKFNLDCSWDGSEGRALADLLAGNKQWTEAQILGMVDNVFASHPNYGRPREWLRRLSKWADGPKDEFGKNLTGRKNGQTKSEVGIDNLKAALAERRSVGRVARSEAGDSAEHVSIAVAQ